MPIILQNHSFNVDNYEELNHIPDDIFDEYNELAEQYNKLLDEKAELERKNRQKAYEVINQQERSR